jgi:hypothetical protein
LEVVSFDGFVPGCEDDVIAVHDEPHGSDMGSAVFSNGGDGGRPGLFQEEFPAFLFG